MATWRMWAQGSDAHRDLRRRGLQPIWTQPSGMISRMNHQPFDMNGDGYSGAAAAPDPVLLPGQGPGLGQRRGTVSTSCSAGEQQRLAGGIIVGDINDGYDDVFVHNHPGGSVVRSPSGGMPFRRQYPRLAHPHPRIPRPGGPGRHRWRWRPRASHVRGAHLRPLPHRRLPAGRHLRLRQRRGLAQV